MTSVSRLKDKAREHERKEDWRKAIDAYLQVINKSEAGGSDAELSLYNRVGDLFLKIGEDRSAVDYYERAAERYGESGLYNNAIALCNKALRYEPGRVDLYRRLGQLSAEQGFVTDARRWYLEYAERLMKAGRPDDAFHALDEFAALSEDPEVREVLATQLVARGETDKAVTQLRLAYSARLEVGENAEAAAVRERLAELAPQLDDQELALDAGDHVPDEDEDEGAPLPQLEDTDVDAGDVELDELEPDEAEPVATPEGFDADELETGELEVEDVDAPEVPGLIATDMGADAALEEEPDEDAEPLPTLDDPFESGDEAEAVGLEESDEDSLEDVEPLPGFESAGAEEPEYEPETTGTLEGLDTFEAETETDADTVEELPGFEEAEEEEAAAEELPGFEEAEEEAAAAEELPGFEEAEEEAAPAEELPGFEEAEAGAVDEELPGFEEAEAPVTEEVAEPAVAEPAAVEPAAEESEPPEPVVPEEASAATAEAELTEAIEDAIVRFRTGEEEAALRDLKRLHAGLAEEGRVRDARRAADAAVELDPDSLPTHQHRVEYAFRAGDRRELVAAYLDFAAALRRGGMGDKAQSVFRRVLEIEPSNRTAQAALAPPAEPAAPTGGDFVDLGSMLLDDSEETTRFRVAETHESGDEERDFEEMLSQFRAKVAEHVSEEDTESHYDLGLAFKEMGLVDEAIAEFQTAMRGGDERLKVYEELGQCFMLKEQYGIAAKLLGRAAQLPASDETELLGVYYGLGRCYEELGRAGDAREAYERVLGLDIDFRDVNDRMRSL